MLPLLPLLPLLLLLLLLLPKRLVLLAVVLPLLPAEARRPELLACVAAEDAVSLLLAAVAVDGRRATLAGRSATILCPFP